MKFFQTIAFMVMFFVSIPTFSQFSKIDTTNNYLFDTHGEVVKDEFNTVSWYLRKISNFLNAKSDSIVRFQDKVEGFRISVYATDDLIWMEVSEKGFHIDQITYELDLNTYSVKVWHTDLRLDLSERRGFVSLLNEKNNDLGIELLHLGKTKRQIREMQKTLGQINFETQWSHLSRSEKREFRKDNNLGKFIRKGKLWKELEWQRYLQQVRAYEKQRQGK